MDSEKISEEQSEHDPPVVVKYYNREEIKILNELERMKGDKFYQWFVYRLQPLEISTAPRSVGAPWELIIWAYKTMEEELRTKIIRCADHLLTDIGKRDPNDVNAAETYHLSLIISHLQLRQMRDKLRQLVGRKCTYSLKYHRIDIREQMLYHLESLEHRDLNFWKKEAESQRFVGPAFLAMTRFGQEEAILYFPHLVEASRGPKGVPLTVILRMAFERSGMDRFNEKIIDLFSNMPDEDKLPPILKTMNKINREKYWQEYGDLAFKALKQLGFEVKPRIINTPTSEIKITKKNSLGIVIYERLVWSVFIKSL